MTDLAPGNVPEKPEEFAHYYDMAREIVRRVRHRAHLSDDEIIVLAMVAAQISLTQYVEPHRELDADDTLNAILDILDRGSLSSSFKQDVVASKSSSASETQRAGRIHAGRL